MRQSDILQSWHCRPCTLATMHHKEKVISPQLKKQLGINVTVPKNFNTDQFGTFTREIKRTGNQLEAARRKALAAMKLTGYDLGIASEGSFGSHPTIPFLPSNLEIVVLIDSKNDLEIVGHHRSSQTQALGESVSTTQQALEFATKWGFPQQGVIIRRSKDSGASIYKNITTIVELQDTAEKLLSKVFTKTIYIETDMRADRCPTRMQTIKQATADLIINCTSLCPKCQMPGFVITTVNPGLICSGCGLATDMPKELVYSCQKCSYTEPRPIKDKVMADPGECQWCNP